MARASKMKTNMNPVKSAFAARQTCARKSDSEYKQASKRARGQKKTRDRRTHLALGDQVAQANNRLHSQDLQKHLVLNVIGVDLQSRHHAVV